jgi:hypothetical protein
VAHALSQVCAGKDAMVALRAVMLQTRHTCGTVAVMSDQQRIVQMHLMNPGSTAPDGDFTFEMQPRYNSARTVKYALTAQDVELLHRKLGEYLKAVTKI